MIDVVLLVDIRRGTLLRDAHRCIPHLYWQSVLKIQDTSLTDILDLTTSRTDFRLFEPHPRTWIPSKDGKGPLTDLALLSKTLL